MVCIYQGYTYTDGENTRYVDSIHHHNDLDGTLVVAWIDKENDKKGSCLYTTFAKWAKNKI